MEEEQTAAYCEIPIPTDNDSAGIDKETFPAYLYKGQKFNSHDPKALDEQMATRDSPFPDGSPQETLGFLGGDIDLTVLDTMPAEARNRLRIFGRTMQETLLISRAEKVAALILGGQAQEIEEAIAIVKKCPEILRCPPVIARDRSGSPAFRLMTNETKAELDRGEKYLYLKRADDGGLDYQVLGLDNQPVEGHITSTQLGQEIKAELTLPQLDVLRGRILDITSKRKHTLLGRAVQGTVLGIAAMAGDVDFQEGLEEKLKQAEDKEEKATTLEAKAAATKEKQAVEQQRGVVERLAAIKGGLSKEEVAAQLEEAVTGEKAKQANQQRVERIMIAVKQFGEGILSVAKEYQGDKENYDNLNELQTRCQLLIDQLEQVLQHNPKEIIKSGLIFDEDILYQAANWFEYGYELCDLPKRPDDEIKLEKGRLYVEEKEGYIAYSALIADVDGKDREVRHTKTTLQVLKETREVFFKEVFASGHLQKNRDRFGGWTIMGDVFWINGIGKLLPRLSARGQDIVMQGIRSVVYRKVIPVRGALVPLSAGCGVRFYVGSSDQRALRANWPGGSENFAVGWRTCVDQKQQHYENYAATRAGCKTGLWNRVR